MMDSLSFWGMSPCMDDTVKLASLIFSVSQSTWANTMFSHGANEQLLWNFYQSERWWIWTGNLTFLLVLQKITAWVMVRVSYRSQRVSNFHSSLSTATKNCFIPSRVSSSLRGSDIAMGRKQNTKRHLVLITAIIHLLYSCQMGIRLIFK